MRKLINSLVPPVNYDSTTYKSIDETNQELIDRLKLLTPKDGSATLQNYGYQNVDEINKINQQIYQTNIQEYMKILEDKKITDQYNEPIKDWNKISDGQGGYEPRYNLTDPNNPYAIQGVTKNGGGIETTPLPNFSRVKPSYMEYKEPKPLKLSGTLSNSPQTAGLGAPKINYPDPVLLKRIGKDDIQLFKADTVNFADAINNTPPNKMYLLNNTAHANYYSNKATVPITIGKTLTNIASIENDFMGGIEKLALYHNEIYAAKTKKGQGYSLTDKEKALTNINFNSQTDLQKLADDWGISTNVNDTKYQALSSVYDSLISLGTSGYDVNGNEYKLKENAFWDRSNAKNIDGTDKKTSDGKYHIQVYRYETTDTNGNRTGNIFNLETNDIATAYDELKTNSKLENGGGVLPVYTKKHNEMVSKIDILSNYLQNQIDKQLQMEKFDVGYSKAKLNQYAGWALTQGNYGNLYFSKKR